MLDKYYEKPTRLRQLRRGPLGPHLDDFAAELYRQGFKLSTGKHHLSLCAKFSTFAQIEGVSDVARIDDKFAQRFLDDLATEGRFPEADCAVRLFMVHLRSKGIVARVPMEKDEPREPLLDAYDAYLRDVKGLQASTREGYLRGATRFLQWVAGEKLRLRKLSRANVLSFITASLDADEHSPARRVHVASQTRCFLRFLGGEGHAPLGLERTVPRIARWRLDKVPRHLPWEKVRQLIDSVNTSHAFGLRDKAVLLLLAMLGLRNSEVRRLRLTDVRWRSGEIHLPKTKSSKARVLPMPHEVGAALADYVLHGRPVVEVPEVFVTHRAPYGPFSSPAGVGAIVGEQLRRTGIAAPSRGAHMLRHSIATRMVNEGVPIKTIADVLGHKSIDTTAIYTKVDVKRLELAALPFPTGGAR